MQIFDNARIMALMLNHVGNKTMDQGYTAATAPTPLTDEMEGYLRTYFFKPFKGGALFQFRHEANLEHNDMYRYCQRIFSDPDGTQGKLASTSPFIIEHLYGCTDHPQVKPGEVCVVYFADCIVGEEMCDAIGIFKSEKQDVFLNFAANAPETEEMQNAGDTPETAPITVSQGFAFDKLDKGVIIYNTEAHDGYRMAIVTAGGQDSLYWKEAFLNVAPAKNNVYLTQEMLRMAKEFAQDVFPVEDKIGQAVFLGKVKDYFQEKEIFDPAEFAEAVLGKDEEKREKLTRYQQSFADEIGVPLGEFGIAEKTATATLKKPAYRKKFRLDSGVIIELSGGENMADHIVRDFDEQRGMFRITIHYMEES